MDVGELFLIALIVAMWAVPIVLVVLGVRWLLMRTGSGLHASGTPEDPALAVLRERYARAEIDAAEFEERKQTLGG